MIMSPNAGAMTGDSRKSIAGITYGSSLEELGRLSLGMFKLKGRRYQAIKSTFYIFEIIMQSVPEMNLGFSIPF